MSDVTAITLGQKQRKFTLMVAMLITWIYQNKLEATFGEAYRTPEQAALNEKTGAGISNSLHTQRLAVDLMLFRNGKWLQDPLDYALAGAYWKSIGGSWGGDFKRKDAVHFSLEHNGVR